MKEIFTRILSNRWLMLLFVIGILLLVFGASGGLGGNLSANSGSNAVLSHAITPLATGTQATSSVKVTSSALSSTMAFEQYVDRELERMIDQIAGIRDAMVMVSVGTTWQATYGQNTNASLQTTVSGTGSNRSETTSQTKSSTFVLVPDANGNQTPIVVDDQLPKITGVFVIAKANDPIKMRADVTGAIEDVLGIPSFTITVLERKA